MDPSTPDPLIVPGEVPAGLVPTTATVVDVRDGGRFRLFGNPELPTSSDGEQLVVGTYYDSAQAFVDCDVPDSDAVVCGSWTVAQRPIEQCNGDCVAVVLGRRSSIEHVSALGDSLSFDDETQSVVSPDALPPGIVELIDVPLSIHRLTTPGAQLLEYRGSDEHRVSVSVADGGEPLAELLRFFVDEGGRAAPFSAWRGEPSLADVSVVDDNVAAVLASGIDHADMENLVASLHPDRGAEWDALRGVITRTRPEDILPDEAGQPFVAVVGGRLEGGQWAVGYQRYEDGRLYQEIATHGPDPEDFNGGGSGDYGLGPSDTVTFVGGLTTSGGEFPGTFYTGFAPAETATMIVEVDGRQITAALGEKADLPGAPKPWGVHVGSEGRSEGPAETKAIAFDVSGTEIARSAFHAS